MMSGISRSVSLRLPNETRHRVHRGSPTTRADATDDAHLQTILVSNSHAKDLDSLPVVGGVPQTSSEPTLLAEPSTWTSLYQHLNQSPCPDSVVTEVTLPARFSQRIEKNSLYSILSQVGDKPQSQTPCRVTGRPEAAANDQLRDIPTALLWLRQEIVGMKKQDRELMRRMLEIRATVRNLYGLSSTRSLAASTHALQVPDEEEAGSQCTGSAPSDQDHYGRQRCDSEAYCLRRVRDAW